MHPPFELEAGAGRCGACEAIHHLEVSVHCHHCDLPLCPLCVVRVRRLQLLLCPDCGRSAQGPGDGQGGR